MIKNLSGEYETIEYENQRFIMLYDNIENEPYPMHWHNAIEIIIPLENGFTVETRENTYHLNEKDIIIIPPGELHYLHAQEGRRIIFQCNNSVISDSPALESLMPVFSSVVQITPQLDKDLYVISKKSMLDIYSAYYSKSPTADVKIYVYLINLLTALRDFQLQQYKEQLSVNSKSQEYNEKFNLVLNYINKNYMEDISLDQLASLAGYSKYHFSRIFKQYNSMSYIQYINAKRIKTAERLLMDSNLPITEVAMRSGFSSLATFNRTFKEIKHCTPTDFQKLYVSTCRTEI